MVSKALSRKFFWNQRGHQLGIPVELLLGIPRVVFPWLQSYQSFLSVSKKVRNYNFSKRSSEFLQDTFIELFLKFLTDFLRESFRSIFGPSLFFVSVVCAHYDCNKKKRKVIGDNLQLFSFDNFCVYCVNLYWDMLCFTFNVIFACSFIHWLTHASTYSISSSL